MTQVLPRPTEAMLTPTMSVRKDIRNNWRAESAIDLTPLGAGFERLQLDITTMKVFSGSTVTSATVAKRDGAFMVHAVHQDYSKRLALVKVRGTEKAVRELQEAAIKEDLADVLAEVIAQYAPKGE